MTHRALTLEEQQTLMLANQGAGSIVLVPVQFNGEERIALALHGQNPHGQYLRILGVLLRPMDVITDAHGNATESSPPGPARELN